jgi:hypothetical protein
MEGLLGSVALATVNIFVVTIGVKISNSRIWSMKRTGFTNAINSSILSLKFKIYLSGYCRILGTDIMKMEAA